eukprot:jgi/Mesen1/9776/ME000007S09824
MSRKFGTWTAIIPGFDRIFTVNPVNVEHMLKTKFSNYPKGPVFQTIFREFLGHGIFNSDGNSWTTQRKSASYEFATKSLRDLMVHAFCKESQERLLPTLQRAAVLGQPLDLQDIFARYAYDTICLVGFGADPCCLALGFPAVPSAQAFDAISASVFHRIVRPLLVYRVMSALNIGSEKTLRDSMLVVNNFTQKVIDARKLEHTLASEASTPAPALQPAPAQGLQPVPPQLKGKKVPAMRVDLLSRFLSMPDADGRGPSDEFLRDVATNFILAGRDTSSMGMTWFFWLLSRHPEVEQQILDEVRSIIGARAPAEGAAAANPDSKDSRVDFTYGELKAMTYLHAALTESMRLYPPVPQDYKYAAEDDTWPDGTSIPAGTHVVYDIYAMGRQESIWGPDCLEFKPDRWLKDGEFVPESPFKYPVFNAGPRTCLGKDMAYLLMKTVVASTLLSFKVNVKPGYEAKYRAGVTLGMAGGLPVTIEPRSAQE